MAAAARGGAVRERTRVISLPLGTKFSSWNTEVHMAYSSQTQASNRDYVPFAVRSSSAVNDALASWH